MKQIHINIDNDLWDMIEARLNNTSLQDFVTDALKLALMNKSKDSGKKFRFIDLFAGIGGMRLAYEQAGGECMYSSEWNKYSQKTYFANFGELPDGDITKVDARSIPNHDILVAGISLSAF